MIVRCERAVLSELSPDDRAYLTSYVHLDEVNLQVGGDYVVLGVGMNAGRPWFLIVEERTDEYPKPHFAGFFTVVDDRIPPGWALSLNPSNFGTFGILPAEWASDPRFLEKLVDEVPAAAAAFAAIKDDTLRWHNRDRISPR